MIQRRRCLVRPMIAAHKPQTVTAAKRRLVIALQRGVSASRTRTQSPSPDLLVPEGINSLLPSLANGESFTSAYSPLVGSYQRAVVVPASFDISTVMARIVGM